MNESNEIKEFDILGHKVRLTESSTDISPEEVIQLLKAEIGSITNHSSNLDRSKTILLASLKLAADNVRLKKECKEQINSFESSINKAMEFINKFKVVEDNSTIVN